MFFLPIFGNRPGTEQHLSLTFISTLLLLATSAKSIIQRKSETDLNYRSNKLFVLKSAYFILAICSLTSLPWNELLMKFPNFFQLGSLASYPESIYRIITADELKEYYPLTAIINLFLVLQISKLFYEHTVKDSNFAINSFAAILVGLVFSLVSGLADYYGLINLRFLRSLDPIVNPGDQQFRLQSFFGHSGWYAEYLTFCIPMVICTLLMPIKFYYRLALSIFLMIVGEYTLILTYQRGGWLSYPLSLFAVWTAIYIFRLYEQGRTDNFISLFKSAARKILISLPLTIIFSMLLVKGIAGENSDKLLNKYKYRVAEITKTNDRTEFMKAGFDFGLLRPFLGGGIDSFALQYEKEVADSNGRLYQKYNLPLHGSAHNFYMQIFSGTGIAGLFCILAIIYTILHTSFKILRARNSISRENLAILLTSAAFCTAIVIYGIVQEIFYVQVLQILFFSVIAVFAATFRENLKSTLNIRIFLTILISITTLHIVWVNLLPGSNHISDFGCYRAEHEPDGRIYKWCSKSVFFNLNPDKKQLIKIQNIADTSTISISRNSKLFKSMTLQPGEYTEEILPPGTSTLRILSNSHFIPSKTIAGSKDNRVLSFKLYE
jgi:O-antigen ligase